MLMKEMGEGMEQEERLLLQGQRRREETYIDIDKDTKLADSDDTSPSSSSSEGIERSRKDIDISEIEEVHVGQDIARIRDPQVMRAQIQSLQDALTIEK